MCVNFLVKQKEKEGKGKRFLFSFYFIFVEIERERENVGSVQQLDCVAAGRAGGGRQPDSVAEDNGGSAAEAVRGEQAVGGVDAGRGARAVGLHAPQRVTVATQVKPNRVHPSRLERRRSVKTQIVVISYNLRFTLGLVVGGKWKRFLSSLIACSSLNLEKRKK